MTDFEALILAVVDRRLDEKLAEMQAKVGEQLLTTDEAAAIARVAPGSIRRWVREGHLHCDESAGSHPRFKRADLLAAMAKMAKGRRKPTTSNDNASLDELVEQRLAKRKAK